MSRLIETISVRDGIALHLSDHQDRMDRSILELYGHENECSLKESLRVPSEFQTGWVKCRVVYGKNIEHVGWQSYHIRPVTSIELVHADDLDYSWKYEDRSVFDRLIRQADTDDVIIVKAGLVTDSSYANLLFRKGNDWFTPDTPLLAGTQRKRLIEAGKITIRTIRPADICQFDALKYINAMLDMEVSPEIPVQVIRRP